MVVPPRQIRLSPTNKHQDTTLPPLTRIHAIHLARYVSFRQTNTPRYHLTTTHTLPPTRHPPHSAAQTNNQDAHPTPHIHSLTHHHPIAPASIPHPPHNKHTKILTDHRTHLLSAKKQLPKIWHPFDLIFGWAVIYLRCPKFQYVHSR